MSDGGGEDKKLHESHISVFDLGELSLIACMSRVVLNI